MFPSCPAKDKQIRWSQCRSPFHRICKEIHRGLLLGLHKIVVGNKIGVSCDSVSILTLLIILCGIRVKSEYGWRRFDLDGRRGLTDYSTVVLSGGWRSGFRASGRDKGLTAIE
ncbi:hypothetical protein HanIR_Chr05g0254311 [Helianthus annuus]|nr:hypothetical protein HanIR_Chr05g0254311 [Helianthus annuus]